MTAREKIERLTNSWYGYNLVIGVISLLWGGIGIFSIVWTALSLAFTFTVTYIIGRKLLNRSSLTRSILLVISTVASLLLTVGLVFRVLNFELSFAFAMQTAFAVTSLSMHVKSLRVLTDKSVKSYFVA